MIVKSPLVGLALTIGALTASAGCALSPVETDPTKAAERAAAMRQDCYSRGGTWSESTRTCVGADPVR